MVLPVVSLALCVYSCSDLLLFAENGCKTADLGSEGGANMLRSIGHKILYSGHDIVEQSCSVDQLAETFEKLVCEIPK